MLCAIDLGRASGIIVSMYRETHKHIIDIRKNISDKINPILNSPRTTAEKITIPTAFIILFPAMIVARYFFGALFCKKAFKGTIYIPPKKARKNRTKDNFIPGKDLKNATVLI